MALQTEQEKNEKAVADFLAIAQSKGYNSVQTQQFLYNNADNIKRGYGDKRGNEIVSLIQSKIQAPERGLWQTVRDQWQSALGAMDAMQQPFMDFFDPSSDWAKENRAERQEHLNNVSEAQQLRNLQAQHNLAQAQANGDWGIAARIQNIASDPFVQTADLAAQALPAAGLLGATYLSGGTLAPVTVPALFGMGAVQGVGGARGDLYEATIAQDDQVLQNHNAEYRQLRQSGMSEAEAKNIVGTNIQEHLGELAGAAVSGAVLERFGLGKALRGQGSALRNLAGEIISEAADEGVQTALANNMKTAVNPNQNLWENVPLAMFDGALMGGMSGALAATLSPKNSTTAPVADTTDQILQAAEQAQTAKIQAAQTTPSTEQSANPIQTAQIDISTPIPETVATLKPEAAQTFRQPETQTEPSALQQAAQATTATGKVATGEQASVDIGKDTQAVTWEIREASDLGASIDKAQNQFRDRTRAASQAQIQQIAQKPDYRYLNNSPVMDYGAPTLAQDGSTIIGGNGRTAGLKQAYIQGTAEQYRADLIANAQQYGFTPEQIAEFEQPVLVRRLNNQVDVQQAAIASNEGGGLVMSALEQAKADATRLPPLDTFTFSETGSLNTGANRHAIAQWVGQFPQNQQAALQDGQGKLSQTGENRLQNAILYQAYGDSPTLARQIESTHQESRNIGNALTQAANTVAQAKTEITYGNLHDLDIADDLTAAADLIEQLRAEGTSVSDWLAQEELIADIAASPEARMLVKYFNNHIRSAKAMRDLITAYYDEVQNLGNPNQADMFGDNIVPTKTELLSKVIQNHENDTTNQSENPSERAEQSRDVAAAVQPETQSTVRANIGQSDTESRANAEVTDFRQPENAETVSSNRAQYDQAKADGKTELTFAQWQQVRTPEFKAWFGDWENDPENASKVINPRTGEPLVVYHGTGSDFSEFTDMPKRDEGWYGKGHYFTELPDVAEYYATRVFTKSSSNPTPNLMPVYLNIRNPFKQRE